MCDRKNPLRVKALRHVSFMLNDYRNSCLRNEPILRQELAYARAFAVLCSNAAVLELITMEECVALHQVLDSIRRDPDAPFETVRCEDCDSDVPSTMTRTLGEAITLCDRCCEETTRPISAELHDVPRFMAGMPLEMD
jgi:hypothetical protein